MGVANAHSKARKWIHSMSNLNGVELIETAKRTWNRSHGSKPADLSIMWITYMGFIACILLMRQVQRWGGSPRAASLPVLDGPGYAFFQLSISAGVSGRRSVC